MTFLLQIIVNGITNGAIYAIIAVGFSITFTTMRVLNFALGMWVMLGGMLTYTFYVMLGWPLLVTLAGVLVSMAILGVAAERTTIYPFVKANSEAWVMSTLAVGLLFVDSAQLIWGRNAHAVPSYVGDKAIRFAGIGIFPQSLFIIVSTIIVFLVLEQFYYRSLWGSAFRAVAQNPETASLMGINARLVAIGSYALTSALAGFAGWIVVPITLAQPQMGTVLGLKAFVVPIIAGLAAPRGILLCSFGYGILEGAISGYLFSGLRDIVGFSLMILILWFKPEGLFGKPSEERA
jgi:branched-chain amino acid transport system permease protein